MRICAPLIAAALVSLSVAPALAASDAGSQSSATTATTASKPPPAKPDPNEVICKYQQTVGTRIPSARECRTRAQWDEMSNRGRDTMDNMQQRGDTLVQRGGG